LLGELQGGDGWDPLPRGGDLRLHAPGVLAEVSSHFDRHPELAQQPDLGLRQGQDKPVAAHQEVVRAQAARSLGAPQHIPRLLPQC
jgi:hypothetical protein